MTTIDKKDILELEKFRVEIKESLQRMEHAPIKLYLAIGTVMGAGVIKIIEVLGS